MVDDPNKTEGGSFIDDEDFLAADAPMTDELPEKQNLKQIWDQNPSLKIFAIVAGVALLIIGFMLFSGGDAPKTEEDSNVRPTAGVSQPPGTAELPPAYEEAVRQSNAQIADQAEQTGASAIPTPIARPTERIEAPVQVEESDPLSEWRREAETRRMERQQQEDAAAAASLTPPPPLPTVNQNNPQLQNGNIQQAPNPPLPTAPTPDQIQAIAGQLQQFMGANVIEPQTPKESVVISMNVQPPYDMKKYFPPDQQQQQAQQAAAAQAAAAQQKQAPKPIIQAGTIAYAQILTEANSDIPGPVLAEIASGPLAGGRAIGSFQVAEEHLVVQFSRIVKDGVEYSTSSYALDPKTTLPGMATDVNHHYFTRVFLPAAAEFIQGFAEAATQKDTQVVVSNGTVVSNSTNDLDTKEEVLKGVNEGAQKLSEIVDDSSDRPITVKIHAGTRIGILFVQSVMDPNALQQQQNQYGQPQSLGQAVFNATPAGQAYNAYNAYNNYQQQQQGYGGSSAPPGSFAAVQQQQQMLQQPPAFR